MVAEVKIEKNVPLPESLGNKFGKILSEMKINESFTVPAGDTAAVRGAIQYYKFKNIGKAFTTRTVNGGSHKRIWRIE